ncbi:MAG TPA: type 4a pilus biogenesis protein PilO [Thermoanaerobaculia bacterium]|nr:type 4a pilus biogenesis protein PilO [Thermoanaerobaculia bacterium]
MIGGRRIWAKRAGLLGVAGIALAANLGFFLWYRGTARERKAALETRRDTLEREVRSKEADAKKLGEDRARLSEVRRALDEFYGHRVGARRETLAGVVDEVHAILKKFGVSPGQIGYGTSKVENPPLTQMSIAFSFKGDYNKFKQLLDAFQSSRRWLAVRDVALSRDQETPGSVQVHVSLVTYFLGEEPEPARASLPGGSAP